MPAAAPATWLAAWRRWSGGWTPTRDELLACHHSQNGFVIERMRDPDRFDRELTVVVDELASPVNGGYRMQVSATVVWGVPG